MRPVGVLLALLCAAALAAAAPAAPRNGMHYSGQAQQGQRISFDVSATGAQIVHPILYLVTHCSPGHGVSFATTSARTTARASGPIKHGKFQLHFSERAKVKGGVKGVTARASFALSGRFASRGRAAGTARVIVHYSDGVTCVSGPVNYSVKA